MIFICPWCEADLGRNKEAAISHEAECDIGPDLDMGIEREEI